MTSKKGLRARHRIAKRRLRSPESKQHGEEAGPPVSAPLVAGSHQPCDRLLLVTPASSTIHSPPSSLKGLIENPVFSGPLTATCDKMWQLSLGKEMWAQDSRGLLGSSQKQWQAFLYSFPFVPSCGQQAITWAEKQNSRCHGVWRPWSRQASPGGPISRLLLLKEW